MNKFLFLILLVPGLANAEIVKGDGTLDFTCQDKNLEAKPFSYLDFTLMYDDETGEDTGWPQMGFDINITQFPYFAAEIPAVTQPIPGCKFAKVITMEMVDLETGTMEINFECDADGDAGYGTVSVNPETKEIKGEMNFPEGQGTLLFPIVEDTKIELSCEFSEDRPL